MSYTPNIPNLQISNSTSYADLLGLQLGLPRLQGETTNAYVKRLEFAAHLRRTHPYEGALNEINLQLGVEPATYINVELGANTIISCSIAGIVLDNDPSAKVTIPLLEFDNDTMWDWRLLSDIVLDLNDYVPATLLVADGPAFQLARQSNSLWSFAEAVSGVQSKLKYSGIQVGSEMFNQTVPTYTLTEDGELLFSAEPPSSLTITYNYISTPYALVGSPVALIGFLDPEFSSVAVTSGSALAYQLREFIQQVMLTDRSYWAA